ncbi:pyridoxamine 5'-phosphate oxidase family protein [Prauserella flavalba]|uniref:pyridoxamine 5'-phosphate oxidase family protein n=1 Tax=Prauserella flavalba TaxID=1477506 RepID=UPI0036E26862
MTPDQVIEVMDKPISRELLASSIPARFSYVGLDGDPRVVPIGFHWSGAELVIATVPTSAKVKALRANPRVAITIDTDGFPPRVLLVRGSARLDEVEGIPEEYLAAAHKVVPDDQYAEWEAGVRALYQRMTRITVTPDWAKLLDFETTLPKAVEDLVRAQQG